MPMRTGLLLRPGSCYRERYTGSVMPSSTTRTLQQPALVQTSAPAAPQPDLLQARALIMRYGWNATAYQVLNPGMQLWFDPAGDGVVGAMAHSGYRMVVGAPVCPPERVSAVAAAFAADAARAGQHVCYCNADERLHTLLHQHPPASSICLGAQPVWQPANWPARLKQKSSLRAQINRARNKQVQATLWSNERAANHPDLLRCLDEWLHTRGLPPLHFMVSPILLERLFDRRVWVAERDEHVIGFLVASPVPLRQGWFIEQIIRGQDAPNGTTELLLDAAMRHLADDGAAYVTLGLSPLSQQAALSDSPTGQAAPFWLRLALAWTRAHGQRFYNFAGLERFKAKFLPDEWEPLYAVCNQQAISPQALYALAGVLSNTHPLRFVGHALLRAAAQETHWLRQRFRL